MRLRCKVLYQLVLGENEVANGTVTYREYGKQAQNTLEFDAFVAKLLEEINEKKRVGE